MSTSRLRFSTSPGFARAFRRRLPVLAAFALVACDVTGDGLDLGDTDSIADAITYRELPSHPGCSTAQMSYTSASVAGYSCAAKDYTSSEDQAKPIVLLVHGNSDSPAGWEAFGEGTVPQLADRLPAAGFRTLAVDLRIDLVDDPQGDNDTENAARNIDHGWSTPIVEQAIRSTMEANPDRQVIIMGFSLGVTVVRDALRRLHLDAEFNPWPQISDLVYLAGANHGVSSCALCGANPTMRGQVACEMGCRDSFSPTDFMKALNGPSGIYETPCSDGGTAYGADVCEGNAIDYTTVVMRDIDDGTYQDLFVSEASARLLGADNRLISLEDTDDTGYFFDGLFKNHYGAARSAAAIEIVMEKVQ